VFAGQRNDGFFVDLGAIFDLGDIRPIQHLHLIPTPDAPSVDPLSTLNIHAIAIKVPISMLTKDGSVPSDPASALAVLGIWGGASRRKVEIRNGHKKSKAGPWMQVSRLGNPLFNEVIVPVGDKDHWNAVDPIDDRNFVKYVKQPELAKLLPVLYPGVFPNLAAYSKPRADLHAILLTGLPAGVVPGFQNFTGTTEADMLRLNVAVPPASKPNTLGLVAGDPAGFPNGRRVIDDVTTVELRAIAELTIPLVDKSFTPDGAASQIDDGTTDNNGGFRSHFPYLATPNGGYQTKPGTSSP